MLENTQFPYYIHGSEDSLDVDVYFVVPELQSFNESKKLCDGLSQEHGVNGNLIVIDGGIVTDVYKGTIDEVNNSLLATYSLHPQSYLMPIAKKVDRDICLKWLRVIRGILSHCSRTQYRSSVKEALRAESIFVKIQALSELDFTQIKDFGKEPASEVYKFICFQAAQYLALLEGIEIFTKASAASYMQNAECRKFLYRQEGDVSVLNILATMIATFVPVKSFDAEFSILRDGAEMKTPFGILNTKSEKYL